MTATVRLYGLPSGMAVRVTEFEKGRRMYHLRVKPLQYNPLSIGYDYHEISESEANVLISLAKEIV